MLGGAETAGYAMVVNIGRGLCPCGCVCGIGIIEVGCISVCFICYVRLLVAVKSSR